ncbi:MAG: phage tail protein [Sphingomonas bacterium]|jgi:phage tail sheath protein FI|nr:phage tail sheath subtilisin-like domain-containing protein [Sphingomonas bacterium]MDB5690276.1 phage tail protein [Sphingomonas bacterium]
MFHHGISVEEVANQSRAIATIATAVIGMVVTGPAADAAMFPLDTPVLVADFPDAIAKAGETGTLKRALVAIADQVRCPLIVVRVAPGIAGNGVTAPEATNANVIGAVVNGRNTGLQALLTAEASLKIRPRIIGAPGLDTAPVATALAVAAKKLRGMAYAAAIGADLAALTAYRGGFTQRELMLLHPDFLAPEGAQGGTATSFAVARALGLRARIDQEQGWHKTLSNVPVEGVVGTTRDVPFDLQDPDCEANLLNTQSITTIVPINGALRFWGSRTCAPLDSDFTFESATRTAQILADTIAAGLVWAIDRPLTPSLARDIVEEINEKLRKLKRAGQILGAEAYFDADRNTAATLKQGQLTIGYRYTPVPPLEHLSLRQEISDEYLADFGALAVGG